MGRKVSASYCDRLLYEDAPSKLILMTVWWCQKFVKSCAQLHSWKCAHSISLWDKRPVEALMFMNVSCDNMKFTRTRRNHIAKYKCVCHLIYCDAPKYILPHQQVIPNVKDFKGNIILAMNISAWIFILSLLMLPCFHASMLPPMRWRRPLYGWFRCLKSRLYIFPEPTSFSRYFDFLSISVLYFTG